jgi:hypothetical protein
MKRNSSNSIATKKKFPLVYYLFIWFIHIQPLRFPTRWCL